MVYLSYHNTPFIKKWRGVFWCIFFKLRKCPFFRRKYRFSQYRYTIPVRKFEIRIRSEKLHIVYKNHLDSPKGRFWLFFLVRYLRMLHALSVFFGAVDQKDLRVVSFGKIFIDSVIDSAHLLSRPILTPIPHKVHRVHRL